MKILWAEPRDSDGIAAVVRRLEDRGHDVVLGPSRSVQRQPTEVEHLARLIADCSAVMATNRDRFPHQVFDHARDLLVIAKRGTGVDNIDVPAATERQVLVTNCTLDIHSQQVAEGTIARILALLKHLAEGDRSTREGNWTRPLNGSLRNTTLGLVGYGAIAQKVAAMARGFGTRIVAWTPRLADQPDRVEASVDIAPSLEELLERSDVVSLHCPAPDDGTPIIGPAELAKLRPGAILVNTARAELVDDDALFAAIRQGRVGGVAVDVFRNEPTIDPRWRDPLLADRILLSAHSAGNTAHAARRMLDHQIHQVLTALDGDVPPGVVNVGAIGPWLTHVRRSER